MNETDIVRYSPTDVTHTISLSSCTPQSQSKILFDNTNLFKNIIVDDANRLLYCAIPKVASTNWKRTLLLMRSPMNNTSEQDLLTMPVHQNTYMRAVGLKYLSDYDPKQIEHKVRHYYKFTFVRHPLERLLSAYKDKFVRNNKWTRHFHRRFGRHIIKTYRTNASSNALKFGYNVRFSEFVQYIIDSHASGEADLNKHWNTYSDICQPCLLNYNFVGKLENIERDSSTLLNLICVGKCDFTFPAIGTSPRRTHELMKAAYSRLSSAQIRDIESVYADDMNLFGYSNNVI